MVFAVLGSSQKFDLEFYDLDLESAAVVPKGGAATADPAAAIHLLKTVDHYGMTGVEWDPSGRYLAAHGSSWQSSVLPHAD